MKQEAWPGSTLLKKFIDNSDTFFSGKVRAALPLTPPTHLLKMGRKKVRGKWK
jgi:hypothetical protein